jgi:hypothetical protein
VSEEIFKSSRGPGKVDCRKNPALLSRGGRGHSAALQYILGLTPRRSGRSPQAGFSTGRLKLALTESYCDPPQVVNRKAKRLPTPSISALDEEGLLARRRRACWVWQTASIISAMLKPKAVCPCEVQRDLRSKEVPEETKPRSEPTLWACVSVSAPAHAREAQLDESGCAAARASAASKCTAMPGL